MQPIHAKPEARSTKVSPCRPGTTNTREPSSPGHLGKSPSELICPAFEMKWRRLSAQSRASNRSLCWLIRMTRRMPASAALTRRRSWSFQWTRAGCAIMARSSCVIGTAVSPEFILDSMGGVGVSNVPRPRPCRQTSSVIWVRRNCAVWIMVGQRVYLTVYIAVRHHSPTPRTSDTDDARSRTSCPASATFAPAPWCPVSEGAASRIAIALKKGIPVTARAGR